MSKNTLVLYVTRDGHSRALAEAFARKVGAEAKEIVDLVPRRGLIGYVRSGFQASSGKATPIREPAVDLASASKVVLFQPVWASAVCPPLRSWLKAHRAELAGKKLGLVASNKGSEGGPLRAKFEAEFGRLDAFAIVAERLGEAERAGLLEAVSASLA